VVGDEDMIEAQGMNSPEQFASGFERARQHVVIGERPDFQLGHNIAVSVSSPSRSRPVNSKVEGPTIMC